MPEALGRMETVRRRPHLGSATEEMQRAMGMKVVENVTALFSRAGMCRIGWLSEPPSPSYISYSTCVAFTAAEARFSTPSFT